MPTVKKKEKELARNLPLKSKDDAVKLAKRVRSVQEAIEEKEKQYGIDKLRQELVEAKGRLTGWMKSKTKRLDIGEGYFNYIEPTRKVWIGTKDEMKQYPDLPKGTKPLRSILTKEQWKMVTKRVVDVEALEQLIDEGDISEDKVAPAFVEVPLSGYVRFFRGEDD